MYTTLYKILKSEHIEIPIIQRDYAQGRENKVYLRERLLGSLVKSLKNNEILSLDFVYGTKEHGAMWPLDGQQRLTTLWLLHWYLAVRTNLLDAGKEWLRHFTYETRTSSRDFIDSLCALDAMAFTESKMKIVDFIKDQTWYYSKYNQDPTIQGMLRTLGGTRIVNSENEDIPDGIEEILGKDEQCLTYWQRLISDECPIRFLYKDMQDEDLPLSDDLYIKMNARGKQLTDFENFKADLIGYAPDVDHPSEKLLDVKTASLLDNEWTDVFWKEASEKNVYCVDDIYLEFLRRYFLNRLIATSNLSADSIRNLPLYEELYKGKKEYDGLKNYTEVLTHETFRNLKKLFSHWNNASVSPYWEENESFSFIPQYIIKEMDENGNPKTVEVSTISQKERAVFHAVLVFFEENENPIEDSFTDWIRFAWNIVENSNLNTEEAMIGAIKLFEELRPHSGSILQYLASNEKIQSTYATRQMEEERFKASLLTSETALVWRPLIHNAETHGFLRGSISCLLRYDKKDYVNDIDCFKKKFSKVQDYFESKGIKEQYALCLTQALIKSARKWEQLNWQYLYDTSAEGWKQNILNNDNPSYYEEVDNLLKIDDLEAIPFVSIEDTTNEWTRYANKIKKILAVTDFLNQQTYYGPIVKRGSTWRLYSWADDVQAFYPKRKYYAYIFDWNSFRRNELLHHHSIEVDKDKNPECEGIYWNWTVYFDYKGYSYYWDYKNDIYLLNQQGDRKRRDSRHKDDGGDEYFCIHMKELSGISQQSFLNRLTRLVSAAE